MSGGHAPRGERAPTNRLIAVVPKNACYEFRIRLLSKHRKIDIRIYRRTSTGMEPTDNGAAIMLDKVPAIIAGFQEAVRAAIDEGLIEPEASR
jgi:hypothetical protein